MRLSPDHDARVKDALGALLLATLEACDAPDTEAARKALSAVWFAVHQAQETITTAERATRREALSHIEGQAA